MLINRFAHDLVCGVNTADTCGLQAQAVHVACHDESWCQVLRQGLMGGGVQSMAPVLLSYDRPFVEVLVEFAGFLEIDLGEHLVIAVEALGDIDNRNSVIE